MLFWRGAPALLYGLAFLLGITFAIASSPLLALIPTLLLLGPLIATAAFQQFFIATLVLLSGYVYTAAHHTLPTLPPEGVKGRALVKIHSLAKQSNLFAERWVYRVTLAPFISHDSALVLPSLPCLIALPVLDTLSLPRSRPLAENDYFVDGTLVQTEGGTYRLKVSTKAVWTPIERTWSLAEQRYRWKEAVANWIEGNFPHVQAATFLAGLTTGDFDDHWMRQQFSRFGVQHLLAISGFHFAIVAAFLGLFLRLFLPLRPSLISLLVLLSFYCLFLGPQPSILRAYLMSALALSASLFEKQSSSLNLLGVALLVVLALNPLACCELGFQLSFATTFAILLFYSPSLEALSHLFPKRNLEEALKMHGSHRSAYCFLTFLRQGLALTLAVNAAALPLTLYSFEVYPWMSLLYNLFYPAMASLSLIMLLLGGALFFIPPVSTLIHTINDGYTTFLLQLATQIPSSLDHFLVVESLSPIWVICYLAVVSCIGIYLNSKRYDPASP